MVGLPSLPKVCMTNNIWRIHPTFVQTSCELYASAETVDCWEYHDNAGRGLMQMPIVYIGHQQECRMRQSHFLKRIQFCQRKVVHSTSPWRMPRSDKIGGADGKTTQFTISLCFIRQHARLALGNCFSHFSSIKFVEGILPVHTECGIVSVRRDACDEPMTNDLLTSVDANT